MADDDKEVPTESTDDEIPVIEEGTETFEVEVEEEKDPLELALERAEKAEKEIAYKDAEIQNVRKRFLTEKAELIQYGSMGLARKMLAVLADVDRALNNIDDDDQSPVAQGLRLLRNKMWHELSGDGIAAIEEKETNLTAKMGQFYHRFNDFPSGVVVDVIEAGYMYKQF